MSEAERYVLQDRVRHALTFLRAAEAAMEDVRRPVEEKEDDDDGD